MSEKTAIVTGGTRKDVSAMGVLAINLKKISPNIADEMVVYHDGITPKEQEIISGVFPTHFIPFEFRLNYKAYRGNRSLRYFSPMLFCKYECFKLLEEYERVIWTDYDILIRKDISELRKIAGGFHIVEGIDALKNMFLDEGECVKNLDIDLEKHGITTPLFVLTREIGDYMEYYEWCRNTTRKYAAYIDLPEQCIMSMWIQKFDIFYEKLPSSKYAVHPREDDGSASIVHCYGRPKFWEGLYNEQWSRYYDEWISLGGSSYKKSLKEKLIDIKERKKKYKD